MKLDELKKAVSLVEGSEKNIKNWEELKNRELAIIPTDSKYYQAFKEFTKENKTYYDGKKEQSPSYISGKKAYIVINFLIQEEVDFIKPHKQKLDRLLTL